MINIWRPWKLSNFKSPHVPCPSTSNILPPPWPWTSSFKRTSALQMIINQLKGNIIKGCLFLLSSPSFRSVFVFSINLLILFILLCVQLFKNIMKCLLFIIIHNFNQLVLFTQLENVNKQVTSHSNWPRVLLFDLAQKHVIVSLKDCFTVWRQYQREDFLSVIY